MLAGGLALGVSITIADPFVAEVIGGAGFDFVLIDTVHSPITLDQLQILLFALRTSEATAFVPPAAGAAGGVAPGETRRPHTGASCAPPPYPQAAGGGSPPRGPSRLEGGRA